MLKIVPISYITIPHITSKHFYKIEICIKTSSYIFSIMSVESAVSSITVINYNCFVIIIYLLNIFHFCK